jgi:hypothetical protein
VKKLKARVLGGFFRDRDWLEVFGHPAGDALADAQFQTVNYLRVRVFRSSQHEFVILEYVDQAGIAFHQGRRKIYNPRQNFAEPGRRPQPDANLVQQINM